MYWSCLMHGLRKTEPTSLLTFSFPKHIGCYIVTQSLNFKVFLNQNQEKNDIGKNYVIYFAQKYVKQYLLLKYNFQKHYLQLFINNFEKYRFIILFKNFECFECSVFIYLFIFY